MKIYTNMSTNMITNMTTNIETVLLKSKKPVLGDELPLSSSFPSICVLLSAKPPLVKPTMAKTTLVNLGL